MAWDFSTEPAFQKKLDWVDRFCREEVEPLDHVFPYAVRLSTRDQGAGEGLQPDQGPGPVGDLPRQGWAAWAADSSAPLLNEILVVTVRSGHVRRWRPTPGTWNAAAYGTDEQKGAGLPLLNQEIFSAYSMTEPGLRPEPVQDSCRARGDQWVINGESGSPAGRAADILFVMCTTAVRGAARDAGCRDPAGAPHPQPSSTRMSMRPSNPLGPEDGAKTPRSGSAAVAPRCAPSRSASSRST
jgi:hypothetical protein